ncbi:IS4 family transposase [Catenulispora rubra]|uniref:IS4 family transposase n=1 Tax=Catenulispora rubra TaxID=280293 RepID=UPI001E63B2B9|nr:IS4 family transposase [Catenulispora rubra]
MVSVDRTMQVAPGLFAAGHLGELTALVPFELVDAVLADTGCVQRRVRMLPSRVGVYLVLAMVLFPQVGLVGVWSRLVGGLRGVAGVTVPRPSGKALRDLRRRVSVAPMRSLFEHLAGPTSWPGMPGCRYRGLRMVAVDGCSSFKAPDSPRNRAVFRIGRRRSGNDGWPGVQLLALAECGTRALLGATVTALSVGEITAAAALWARLDATMLLLADAAFDADKVMAAVAGRGAQFLIRANSVRKPAVLAVLPDGSFLTRIGDLRLRVIDAHISVTGADGTVVTGRWRLLTSLTDHRTHPAKTLVEVYHQRWEIETCFFGLRHTLTGRTVLRSHDPSGITQEMWALACLWQILATTMTDAAGTRPGFDPDRCSFTVALNTARDSVIRAENIAGPPDPLLGTIATAVLDQPLDPRRPRIAARVLKQPGSRYPKHRPDDPRPATGTPITDIDTHIQPPPRPQTPTPDPALIHALHNQHPAMTQHMINALAILHTTPGTPHSGRAIARALGITGRTALNVFGVALNTAAHRGHITKTAPGTYTITPQQALTPATNP